MNNLNKQCLILVGGVGSRLGDIVKECPKPFLPINGIPFITFIFENLSRHGFKEIVLLAGYKAEVVREFFQSNTFQTKSGPVKITIIEEEVPLGTAGAILNAKDVLKENFLLLNGDSFFDINYLDLITKSTESENSNVIALRRVKDISRYGQVVVDNNRILSFAEKTGAATPGVINGGIYWLKKDICDLINIEDGPCSLENEVFPKLIKMKELYGVEFSGDFLDIGIPEDLKKAPSFINKIFYKPAVFFDRDGTLNHDSGYTHQVEDFVWMDGAKATIRHLNDKGYYVFVVTNQAGIARGLYDDDAVNKLHQWMNEDLLSDGAFIDDFIFCPHHPDGKIKELSIKCDCRKPEPGMIRELLKKWSIDKSRSILIGDKETDILAAEAIGIDGYLYKGANLELFIEKLDKRAG
jgi:D-glycero-D-manno-heptose 1,7-bisphosphate phosphatase